MWFCNNGKSHNKHYNSTLTKRILMKFDIWEFVGSLSRKFESHKNVTKIMGTLHEAQCIFDIITRSLLLRMRNVSDKRFRGRQNTHFMSHDFFFRKSCRLWDNVAKYCTAGEAIVENTAHAKWMLDTKDYTHKQTNTHTHTHVQWTFIKHHKNQPNFIQPLYDL